MTATHAFRFRRLGGFDQAVLDDAADLLHLEQLDQKMWAALACPVKGLEFDERTLSLVDTDGDGRIRAPEILQAVRWCRERLKDVGSIRAGAASLPLDAIDDRSDAGRELLAAARRALEALGRPEAGAVAPEDVTDTARLYAKTRFNGDGVVPADAADDEAGRRAIEDIVACLGSVPDRSGKPGVDASLVEAFFAAAATLVAWSDRGETEPGLRPFGDDTAAAADAVRAVRAKVDDWFARGRVAAFDPRALAAVNRREDAYLDLAAGDMSVTAQEIAGFPVAAVAPGAPLPLREGINPAWAAALVRFRDGAVARAFGPGRTSLAAAEWEDLCARLAPHEAWIAAKPVTPVEKLGVPRLRELLAGGAREAVDALLARDRALEAEFRAVADVERLARYHRDLYRLLQNFVNFSEFYSGDRPAAFQAGTLMLDGRACRLCVRVADTGKHAALAGMARAYLAYCDCTRPGGQTMTIAAAFTGGDSDFLMPGRNGIFYDRAGRDWDATITRVVENPIGIRQAFWSPYKKFVRLIEEQVAKRAAAGQAESDARMAEAAVATAHAEKTAPKAPPPPKKIDVGTVAALGVAVGALGTLLATVAAHLAGLLVLPFWKICLAAAGILLLISGPAMLIAWIKLRQRNLGPILDANGWAVNGRVLLNARFGARLTSVAALPAGSVPATEDPFAEKPSPWPKLLAVAIALGFAWSLLDERGWIYDWTAGTVGTPKERPRPAAAPGKAPAPAAGPAPATPPAPAPVPDPAAPK
jgi:hypothetical protein